MNEFKFKDQDFVEYDDGTIKGKGKVVGYSSFDHCFTGLNIAMIEDLSGNISNPLYPFSVFTCAEVHLKLIESKKEYNFLFI